MRFCLAVNLRFDKRRIDIAGADGVAGDALLGSFESDNLGQANDPVLDGHIRRLDGEPTKPCADAMLIILPHLFLSIAGNARRLV